MYELTHIGWEGRFCIRRVSYTHASVLVLLFPPFEFHAVRLTLITTSFTNFYFFCVWADIPGGMQFNDARWADSG